MSRVRKTKSMRWLRRNLGRPAILLVLTLIGLVAVMKLWPRRITGMPEARWNQIKVDWRENADVVILGDSRGGSALLPRVMQESLPGRRIKNFSFLGSGYVPGYIDAGVKILDPKSSDPTVILTFASKALTTNREGWPSLADRGWSEVWKWRHIPGAMSAFEPIPQWELINTLRGQRQFGLWRDFRDDGSFVGGAKWRNRAPTLHDAEDVIGKHRVDESIIAGVMAEVRELRARGVTVIGVRTPSSTAIEAIENRLQRLDEADLVRRFQEAGGRWIEVPDRDAYQTYDLSHLVAPEAERFSRWFSTQMLAGIPSRTARTSSTASP